MKDLTGQAFLISDSRGVSFGVVGFTDACERFFDMLKRTKQTGTFSLTDSTGTLIISATITRALND